MPRSSKILFILAILVLTLVSAGALLLDSYPSGAVQTDQPAVVRVHLILFGYSIAFCLLVVLAAILSRNTSFSLACAAGLFVAALVFGSMKLTYSQGAANALLLLYWWKIAGGVIVCGLLVRGMAGSSGSSKSESA
jgi:hypothetical protein